MLIQTLNLTFVISLVLSIMLSSGLFLVYFSRYGMFNPSFASFDEKCVFGVTIAMIAILTMILSKINIYYPLILIIFAQIIPQIAISLYQNYGK